MPALIVTGGAGFIGSALIRFLLQETDYEVINVDKLTYAGNLATLDAVLPDDRHTFEQVDICDATAIGRIFSQYQPAGIIHLAAESHVDRSIEDADAFIRTNVLGTFALLDQARQYWLTLDADARNRFRFHHVSTDEVFGDLEFDDPPFTEATPYAPSSPYSASKASSDHLVRAWHRTYGLPVVLSNCSNNYGPYQYPEKLIPVIIKNALDGKALPVYGEGQNVRDWLYVEDHVQALMRIFENGQVGETYAIGGNNELKNIELVTTICQLLDARRPRAGKHTDLIEFVKDRPGHDLRYAIDSSKLQRELGWSPSHTVDSGLIKTIDWYLANQSWFEIGDDA